MELGVLAGLRGNQGESRVVRRLTRACRWARLTTSRGGLSGSAFTLMGAGACVCGVCLCRLV